MSKKITLSQIWAYFRIKTMRSYKNVFKRIRKYEYDGVLLIFLIWQNTAAVFELDSCGSFIYTPAQLHENTTNLEYVVFKNTNKRIQNTTRKNQNTLIFAWK